MCFGDTYGNGVFYTYYFFVFWRCETISAKEMQINDEIKAKEIRVVGDDGEQLGIMSVNEAKEMAYNKGLDLVMMAPNANPPVCRIMDYGKFRFERDKKEKEARKKQQVIRVKEVQLSCRIEKHDFDTRVNHAKRFLEDGDKVKAVVRFRGREMAHMDLGRQVLENFQAALSGIGAADKGAVVEGRFMTLMLAPVKNSASKSEQKASKASKAVSEEETEE